MAPRAKSDLIKELKAQADVARQESAKVDALFACVGEGLIATDEAGKVFKVNQAALDTLGFRKDELVGKWFPAVLLAQREDGSFINPVDRPITKAFLTGKTINTRMIYLKRDGSRMRANISVSPVIARGKPVGAIEVFRDITADIQSDEMKTQFISVASHQLRTPLAAVNVYSHMLADGYAGELTEDQGSYMNIILAAVNRMNELISTLLNITRIEAGSIIVDPAPTNIDVLLYELIEELRPLVEEKRLRLKVDISPRIPTINTDQILFKEVVSNLLSNAVKYTPPQGSVTISLKTKPHQYLFTIKDTGYGIPIASQPLIFTKFFRASNILDTEVSGTGLGLYLIKIIVENLGGDIWFKSAENKGSTFYFTLPREGSLAQRGTFRLER